MGELDTKNNNSIDSAADDAPKQKWNNLRRIKMNKNSLETINATDKIGIWW